MSNPKLIIHLGKLEENTRLLVDACHQQGVDMVAVTKVTCGDPQVARAMLAGGADMLADSRLENAIRLQQAGITAPIMLLRLPMPSQAQQVVKHFACSLNSELDTLAALNEAATQQGLIHQVLLMVDLGDLREGIWPDQLEHYVHQLKRMDGLRLMGLGVNLTCYGGVIPTVKNLGQLVELNQLAEKIYSQQLPVISGGNSSSLPLLLDGQLPSITQLRLGESIVLGRETVARQPIPGAHLDCFQLQAEIVELRRKPSLPMGEIGQDAFGGRPSFEDRGHHLRAIVALGRQDVDIDSLQPPRDVEILGGSSDHLLLDVSLQQKLKVGDILTFTPGYGALLAAMTSPYVSKEYRR